MRGFSLALLHVCSLFKNVILFFFFFLPAKRAKKKTARERQKEEGARLLPGDFSFLPTFIISEHNAYKFVCAYNGLICMA